MLAPVKPIKASFTAVRVAQCARATNARHLVTIHLVVSLRIVPSYSAKRIVKQAELFQQFALIAVVAMDAPTTKNAFKTMDSQR